MCIASFVDVVAFRMLCLFARALVVVHLPMHQDQARQQQVEGTMNNFFNHTLVFLQVAPFRLHMSMKEGLLKVCKLEAMKVGHSCSVVFRVVQDLHSVMQGALMLCVVSHLCEPSLLCESVFIHSTKMP